MPNGGRFVPGYETSAWYGVGVPKATPAEIVDRITAVAAAWSMQDEGAVRRSRRRADADDGPASSPGSSPTETGKWAR